MHVIHGNVTTTRVWYMSRWLSHAEMDDQVSAVAVHVSDGAGGSGGGGKIHSSSCMHLQWTIAFDRSWCKPH